MTRTMPAELTAALDAIRGVRATAAAVRADTAAADELRRRAAAVAATWRARRIAVYSPDDIAALNALADLLDELDALDARTTS